MGLVCQAMRGKGTKDAPIATVSSLAGQCKISKSYSIIPAESLAHKRPLNTHLLPQYRIIITSMRALLKGLFIPVPRLNDFKGVIYLPD